MAADGQPVIIRELAGDLRELRLERSALPDQASVILGGKSRTIDLWYPGNDSASVQRLGTMEHPIPLAGWLKDVWAGTPGFALAMMRLMESFRYGQRPLEMQWGDVIRVRGYIAETRFPIVRETDIRYELTFNVTEAGAPEVVSETPRQETTDLDVLNVIDSTAPTIEDARNALAALQLLEAVL